MGGKVVITIGRQYGSGGRQIGRIIADRLGIPFYDKELLNRAEEESGLDAEVFGSMDEKRCSNILYSFLRRVENKSSRRGIIGLGDFITMDDRLFLIQNQVLKTIASEGSCVIMGRCSNVVLAKHEDAVHFYVKAPEDYKAGLLERLYGLERKAALKLVRDTDKEREDYFRHYTGKKWGDSSLYNYVIDSSVIGYEATADIMYEIALKKLNM